VAQQDAERQRRQDQQPKSRDWWARGLAIAAMVISVVMPLVLHRMFRVADHHGLPTPRSTLHAGYLAMLARCKACRHRAEADLRKLVDEGRGR